jgi:hypothetical protein
MSINFNTDNSLVLDGVATGLRYAQEPEGTVIYSVERGGSTGRRYPMPHTRYALAYDALHTLYSKTELADRMPAPANRPQFEADLRALVRSISA